MSGIKSKDHAANGADATPPPPPPPPNGAAPLTAAAAQDTAEKLALQAELEGAAAGGARVMQFDENATPEQKAAQAKKKLAEIKPPNVDATTGLGMASDIGGRAVATTATRADIDRVSKLEGQNGDGKGPAAGAATLVIPPDATVGHAAMTERTLAGRPPLKPGEEEVRDHPETRIVSKYLSDQWYGRWWYDAAVLIFAVLATYLLTRFGVGLVGALAVGAVCSTYYNASMRRTRQRARDDLQRELNKRQMASDSETMLWFNHFLDRFWAIYEPVLSATIVGIADGILASQCPAGIDSIRLTTFTLGTKAPVIDSVRSFSTTEDDVVCMDWRVSFTPNDVQDLTVRQAARKVNPKICLTVRLGKGLVGAGIPILVEDISFQAHARIKMKLISNFPHVQTVDLSLMEPPKFDFVLKPVGGNTFGFDIMSVVPGLEGFVKGQVDANMGPMMYYPNVFTLNLQELLSGTPLDTAVGVLQVNVWNARNLKSPKLGGGSPDPYVAISIDDKGALAKTKFKRSTANPQFKSTSFLLLNSLNGMLTLAVMDHNDHRPDTRVGQASWDLAELEKEPEHDNLSSPVVLEGKERGQLQYSLSYYPVLKPEKGPDGIALPLPETRSGVVRLTIHQAKGLEKRGGIGGGDVNPFARVLLNGNRVMQTKKLKRQQTPVWEEHCEFLVTGRRKAVISVQVLNDRDLAKDPTLGYVSVKLDDLLAAREKQQDWFPLSGSKDARVRLSAEWKPVLMSGSVNGGSGYTPAIGVAKFWMHKAVDVKNVEVALGGKSDPYVTLKVRGQQVDGSVIVNNSLNPVWDEILYAPVHSLNETITVEVMDYQNSTKDRSIGTCDVRVQDLAAEGRGDRRVPYSGTGKSARREKLNLGRGAYKGEIFFDVEFLPAVALNGVEFQGAGNEAAAKAGSDDEEGDDPDGNNESAVPLSPTIKADAGGELTEAAKAAGHAKAKESVASVTTVKNAEAKDGAEAALAAASAASGVDMTREELLATQSGVLVFNILDGQVAKKGARLEVAFDDAYWPAYKTEAARTNAVTWDEVGETVVKELDWSRMYLRLRTGESEDDVVAEFNGNTKDVLERALDQPAEFTLLSESGHTSKVRLTCKYIPVDMHLELAETVANTGYLALTLKSATNLRAADKNVFKSGGGTSDPYVVVQLNGERAAKSKVIKKTLNPEWNETLPDIIVPSRVKAECILEVFDWDQVGTADKLGESVLDLVQLEPFEAKTITVPITGKGAAEGGELTVQALFKPEFMSQRGRKGTSLNLGRTFTQLGKGVGGVAQVGGNVVGGVAGGVGVVGKGVGGGAMAVGRGVTGIGGRIIGRGGRKGSNAASGDGSSAILEDGTVVAAGGAADVPAVPPLPEGVEPAPIVDASAVPASALAPAFGGGGGGGGGSHSRTASGDYAASIADSTQTGTPGKRKSRIHNPFKRH